MISKKGQQKQGEQPPGAVDSRCSHQEPAILEEKMHLTQPIMILDPYSKWDKIEKLARVGMEY